MTHYDYLKKFKQEGMLKVLFSLGLDPSRIHWMEIYEYHLANPKMAQWRVAMQFDITRSSKPLYKYIF